MLFSSTVFLWLFLPTVVVLYYVSHRFLETIWSNVLLLIASLFFYAWGEPIYVLLMLFSIALNYAFGILIEKHREQGRLLLIACVAMNLLILGYYKYFNFLFTLSTL